MAILTDMLNFVKFDEENGVNKKFHTLCFRKADKPAPIRRVNVTEGDSGASLIPGTITYLWCLWQCSNSDHDVHNTSRILNISLDIDYHYYVLGAYENIICFVNGSFIQSDTARNL